MAFDLPPVGLREVDWSNPLTRGLKAFYILDRAGYVHNLADRRNHGRWANIADLSVASTREGLATYFSDNATSQRLDLGSVPSTHPLSLYNMPRFTVAARATLDSYTGGTNDHPRLFDKSSSGNAANGWAIYKSNTNTFRFQVDATDVFQFSQNDFPLGVPNTLVYVSRNTTATINGANMSAYVNGQEVTATSTGSNTFPSNTTNAAIGNWNHSTDREWLGSVEYFALWDRDLTDAEVKAIDADIYQILRQPQPLFKAAATGGGVSGSGASVAPAQTSSGTGKRGIAGTGASDAAAQTASGVGGREVAGTGASVAVAQTSTGVGLRVITGSGASTAAAQTSSGTGKRGVVGTGASVAPAQVGEGTSETSITGAGAGVSPAQTASGTGKRGVGGTGASTAVAQTSTGVGLRVIVGTGAGVSPSQTASGAGLRIIVGTGAGVSPAQTSNGTSADLSSRRVAFPSDSGNGGTIAVAANGGTILQASNGGNLT